MRWGIPDEDGKMRKSVVGQQLSYRTAHEGPLMLQYKAGYKFVEGGVHTQVLDFPEAITCGADLDEARRMLASALIDVAETRWEFGEALPLPDSSATNSEMDIEEPIYLHLTASSSVSRIPAGVVVP